MKDNAIILFMKLPSRGEVKTRLEKDLGADIVFELYIAFISDILDACGSADGETLIAYSPGNCPEEEFSPLHGGYSSFRQRGDSLGIRMFNAFNDAYSLGFKKCILIGSDIPSVSAGLLNRAFKALEEADVVIGPSADGGYYLIGNNPVSNSDMYYRDIIWSRADVYENTRQRIIEAGYSFAELETVNDIDDIHDLVGFYTAGDAAGSSETVKVIEKYRDIILKGR